MIDKSKQYRTRDGREVRIYATDGLNGHRVHGAVLDQYGWEHRAWFANGRSHNCSESPLDLIEVRPRIKREVWVNVYAGEQQAMSLLFINKNWADNAAASCKDERFACVRLTIDCAEGEGL